MAQSHSWLRTAWRQRYKEGQLCQKFSYFSATASELYIDLNWMFTTCQRSEVESIHYLSHFILPSWIKARTNCFQLFIREQTDGILLLNTVDHNFWCMCYWYVVKKSSRAQYTVLQREEKNTPYFLHSVSKYVHMFLKYSKLHSCTWFFHGVPVNRKSGKLVLLMWEVKAVHNMKFKD